MSALLSSAQAALDTGILISAISATGAINTIPRTATATVLVSAAQEAEFKKRVNEALAAAKADYACATLHTRTRTRTAHTHTHRHTSRHRHMHHRHTAIQLFTHTVPQHAGARHGAGLARVGARVSSRTVRR